MRRPANGGSCDGRKRCIQRLAITAVAGGMLFASVTAVFAGKSIFDDDFKPGPDVPMKPEPKVPEEPPAPRLPPTPSPVETPKPTPTPTPTPTPEPTPTPTPAPVAPAVKRLPIPAAKDIANAENLVKQVFENEYKVHTPAGKTALAHALLNETRNQQDPLTLYILFRESHDAASVGGDAESAEEAVRGLRDWFLFSDKAIADMEHTTLLAAATSIAGEAASNTPRPEIRAGVVALMTLAERDLAAGDYATAAQVANQAVQVSHKTIDPSLADRVAERSAVMQNISLEYGKVKDAMAGLKAKPADPAANVTAGRFYALTADRLDIGIPCLSKGNDPALKALATQEIAAPTDPAQQSALADAWAAAMKSAVGFTERDAMRRRAVYWYDQAAAQTSGLAQVTAQKRSDDLKIQNLKHGLLGEYFRGQSFAARVFTRVDPRFEFNWNGHQPDEEIAASFFSIRWTGYIKAGFPGAYKLIVIHDDGARIWLDGQLVLDQWGINGYRDTISVNLTGSLQTLKIDFFQGEGGSNFGLGWLPPRATRVRAMPPDVFFHDDRPAGPIHEITAFQSLADGTISLTGGIATLHNPAGARFSKDCINCWTSTKAWLSWDFAAPGGDYDVSVSYSCSQNSPGAEFVVVSGNGSLPGTTEDTGSWDDYKQVRLGSIHLESGGHSLQIRPTKMPGGGVMDLREITLSPVRK